MPLSRFNNRNVRQGVQRIGKIQRRLDSGNLNEAQTAKATQRLGRLQNRYGDNINNKVGRIENRTNQIQNRIDSGLARNPERAQNRLSTLTQRADTLRGRTNPYEAPTPETTPTPDPTPNPQDTEAQRAAQEAQIKAIMSSLFPQTSAADIAGNYLNNSDFTAVRDAQIAEGQKDLDRLYAKGGLTKSGAEIEGNNDLVSGLRNAFSQTAFQQANQDLQNKQSNATRLYNTLSGEADRALIGEQNQFNNMLSTLELLANQSPLTAGYNAANSAAGFNEAFGNKLSSLTSSLFPVYSGGGGGGGGVSMPTYIPSFPGGPSTIPGDSANIAGNAANNANYTDVFFDFIGEFL